MEKDEIKNFENSFELAKSRNVGEVGVDCQSSVNSLILDYYKKFGRKRDLEQYFSLTSAQGDLRDPSGSFWRKMKSENDSSESEERKSSSAQELCRISIRCSIPDPCSSQDENTQTKTESESPPIIIEEMIVDASRHTDEESIKSDDDNSQRSYEVHLDTSAIKPVSPSSSITSQRKLEWDSLADVGYANESDRKNSAASLSTLERLALKQQYSNNDTRPDIGTPTSHSTPLDENDKGKFKKDISKKTQFYKNTKFYKKDVDFVEVNVPQHLDSNPTQSINVNLTKHISFNVEKDGCVKIDKLKKDISVSPEKYLVQTVANTQVRYDKEIQTSLTKTKDNSTTPIKSPINRQRIPVMISLNTLRKRIRRKKSKVIRKSRPKRKINTHKDIPHQEKTGEQLSEAESFEYMPGHIYNQNNMKASVVKPNNTSAGNKSSLESSGGITDSSKGSKNSFTKDLEKSIELLRITLQKRYNDPDTKNKLIKEVVSRLLNSRYRDDDSTSEFLSGLTFNSRKLGLRDNTQTTSSTSDPNNSEDNKHKKPKKSILRVDKFNSNVVASTSQSAPNLLSVASSEKAVSSNLVKVLPTSDSDVSSREKTSSDNAYFRTSSEVLYLKYLDALRREEAYKKHLKEKELFLKQKLVSSDTVFKIPVRQEAIINNKLKDLMKDLTRNNYDDGSGDASKLEGASNTMNIEQNTSIRNPRSHSVFTLSSSHSEYQGKKPNLNKKNCDIKHLNEAGSSKYPNHYCCCPQHYTKSKVGYSDSSVQVNIKCEYEESGTDKPKPNPETDEHHKCKNLPRNLGHVISDDAGDIKYVCLCNGKPLTACDMGDNFLIYKCSRLTNRGMQLDCAESTISNTGIQCGSDYNQPKKDDIKSIQPACEVVDNESSNSDNIPYGRKQSKSSQTSLYAKMLSQELSETVASISDGKTSKGEPSISTKCIVGSDCSTKIVIHEATRCLQTEISINPKISDPSLTDINLVNDYECAKLVDENFREVSKPFTIKSDSSRNLKDGADISITAESESNIANEQENKYGADLKEFEKITSNAQCTRMGKDDYQIPIQGTNMTLMVTLGSEKVKGNLEKLDQACITEKASIVEQATCITDECSKSVQCECSNIATIKSSFLIDDNRNDVHSETTTQSCEKIHSKKPFILEKSMSNTYPKDVQVKKPFLRSNTDTDKFESSCCIQTDYTNKRDVETQAVLYEAQTTSRNKTHDADNDSIRTSEKCNKASPRNECESKPAEQFRLKKDVGIQMIPPSSQAKMKNSEKSFKYTSCYKRIETNTEKDGDISCHTPRDNIPTSCISTHKSSPKYKSDLERAYKTVYQESKVSSISETQTQKDKCSNDAEVDTIKDPILDIIKDITKRYSKTDIEKMKRKKCFKEIMTVLNYLLETDESVDLEKQSSGSCTNIKSGCEKVKKAQEKVPDDSCTPKMNSKKQELISHTCKNSKPCTESSDIPISSDLPATSSDSATCKVLNKIKKECEKYHQKRCKIGKKCEASSSSSMNCEQCKKVHHCFCRSHKCKRSKTNVEKSQKKCIAYNLIIQASESMLSEETTCNKPCRPLQNIVVKVPKCKSVDNKETYSKKDTVYKVEKPRCSPRCSDKIRSRSCPNESEMTSTEELVKKTQQCTVREYLEKNRPDFVENCSQRQNCLKFVSEIRNQDACSSPRLKMVVVHKPYCVGSVGTSTMYCGGVPMYYNLCDPRSACNQCCDPSEVARIANERAAKRDLLLLHVAGEQDLTSLSADQLRRLAHDIGLDLRRKKPAPKFISEKDMKKHSEKIYKTLPEVVHKKEVQKKENIKKTNLLMANIFKKNLQKKTLRGAVNLSNYSMIIKI